MGAEFCPLPVYLLLSSSNQKYTHNPVTYHSLYYMTCISYYVTSHCTMFYYTSASQAGGSQKSASLTLLQLLTALASPPPALRSNPQLHVAVAFRRRRFAAAAHNAILWAYYDYVVAFRQHSRRRAAPSPSPSLLRISIAVVSTPSPSMPTRAAHRALNNNCYRACSTAGVHLPLAVAAALLEASPPSSPSTLSPSMPTRAAHRASNNICCRACSTA